MVRGCGCEPYNPNKTTVFLHISYSAHKTEREPVMPVFVCPNSTQTSNPY